MMAKYQCIQCGSEINKLYREYKAGIIKIVHCESCKEVADKYIEYDAVVIFLDALLLRCPAYRHLLINTHFNSYCRVALLLCVCDAFTKLVVERSELTASNPRHINYTYIGLELYINFIVAVLELMVLLVSVLAMYTLRSLWQQQTCITVRRMNLIMNAVIVASVWRVLAIPALLWGQVYSKFYLALSWAFVFISTFQALTAISPGRQNVWTVCVVAVSFLVQLLVSAYITAWFGSDFS